MCVELICVTTQLDIGIRSRGGGWRISFLMPVLFTAHESDYCPNEPIVELASLVYAYRIPSDILCFSESGVILELNSEYDS